MCLHMLLQAVFLCKFLQTNFTWNRNETFRLQSRSVHWVDDGMLNSMYILHVVCISKSTRMFRMNLKSQILVLNGLKYISTSAIIRLIVKSIHFLHHPYTYIEKAFQANANSYASTKMNRRGTPWHILYIHEAFLLWIKIKNCRYDVRCTRTFILFTSVYSHVQLKTRLLGKSFWADLA